MSRPAKEYRYLSHPIEELTNDQQCETRRIPRTFIDEMVAGNPPATLDFASGAFDTDVSAFLTNLSNAGLIPSATLVSAANASAHLQNQSSSLVGSWSVSDSAGDSILTFLPNGEYVHTQIGASDATGHTGMERGNYTWNKDTGAFVTPCPTVDTNGEWGLSHGTSGICSGTNGTVTMSGNTLTLGFASNLKLARVIDAINPGTPSPARLPAPARRWIPMANGDFPTARRAFVPVPKEP